MKIKELMKELLPSDTSVAEESDKKALEKQLITTVLFLLLSTFVFVCSSLYSCYLSLVEHAIIVSFSELDCIYLVLLKHFFFFEQLDASCYWNLTLIMRLVILGAVECLLQI